MDLFSKLAILFMATEGTPLVLGNVEFWIDNAGPWKDVLSFSVPTSKWDGKAIGESVAQLANIYPEVRRLF